MSRCFKVSGLNGSHQLVEKELTADSPEQALEVGQRMGLENVIVYERMRGPPCESPLPGATGSGPGRWARKP